MKIYTYENPYKITDASFWEEIAEYPHLCVSQTLVEGMKKLYGREAFWCIDTIEAFIKDFYKEWSDNPENQIKQYISITEEILNVDHEKTKKAMKFNQREMHEALRFFSELDLNAAKFNAELLSKEQQIFLEFAKKLKNMKIWTTIEKFNSLTVEDVKDTILSLLDVEFNKLHIQLQDSKVSSRAKRELESKVNYLDDILQEFNKTIDRKRITGIVFHGVHQFTPIILKLIRHLERLGIEVVFLINYHSSFKNIFYTWDKVYRWTNLKMNHGLYQQFNSVKNNLGKAIGGLLEGEIKNWDFTNIEFLKYENLTTFADEIADKFKNASLNKDGIPEYGSLALSRMSEQLYATNNEEINKILQAYFPEQFGDRHFLSYPIGQFILALYNMWDDHEKTLKVSSTLIKECLSANFFLVEDQPTPLEIYNKIELYFKDIETIDQFRSRLHDLIDKVRVIEINNYDEFYSDLRSFSFYNVTYSELQYFGKVIHDLYEITRQLFGKHKSGYINYKQHYQILIEVIKDKSTSSPFVSEKEKELVESIKNQFDNLDELEIDGTIDDLKETIHFYLNRRSIANSANWIVRNFEQIDGGVLLSRKGKAKKNKYHLAMLSDQKMKVGLNDRLSWPLTKSFFEAYEDDVTDLEIVLTSLSEYGNFLRYSLFYSTYYLENELILSYVENSEGEKDNAYFLLEMLGMAAVSKELDQKSLSPFYVNPIKYSEDDVSLEIYPDAYKTVELQKFSICSYRYLLDHVIERDSYFQSEFHCKQYYNSLLFKNSLFRIYNDHADDINEVVKQESSRLREYFPFWKEIDFYDAEARIIQNVTSTNGFDPYYIQLKIDFLNAKLTKSHQEDELNLIYDIHLYKRENSRKAKETASLISKYLNSNDLSVESVHPLICNYCKQREVCLHHFKEVED